MGILRNLTIDAFFKVYNLCAARIPAQLSLPNDPFMALREYFDEIWVLTIPRNTERQAFMTRQLKGLDFKFFEGIDGKSFREGDTRIDLRAAESLNRRAVRINELACTMSHLVMFQAILDRRLDRVFILEDDAVLLEDNKTWIPYCLERLPADWELFYFGYRDAELRGFLREFQELLGKHRDPNEVVSRGVGRGVRTAGGHDYTHAYAVTRSGAQKMLEGAYPVGHTADGWLEHNVLSRKVVAYISIPKVFAQKEDLGSSIHSR